MAIKINGSNIAQMKINGYDITLAKLNGDIVFQKLKLVKTFYGDSKQNTTTGKNKFDYFKTPFSESDSILNGATVLYNEDTGILSINNINKSGSATIKSVWKSNTNAQILPAGTYYIPFQFNITKVSGGGSQTSIGVNTFDSDVYLNQWFIVVDSGNIKNVVMQINEGDTQDTIFEPYTGGQPSPNPDYPQEVKSIISANLKLVGKNLLFLENKSGTLNGITYNWEGTKLTLNGTATVNTDIYNFGNWGATTENEKRLLPAGQYTLSISGSNPRYKFSLNLYTGTEVVMYTLRMEEPKLTRELTSDKYYSNCYISIPSDVTFDNETFYLQLEEGSTATEYEPYKTGTVPINLQGNILSKVGDYADELQIYSNGDVKLVKKTREYTVTGQEDFTNTRGTNLFDCQSLFDDKPFIAGSGLSNYYRYISAQQGVNNVMVHGDFVLQNAYYPTNNLFIKDTNYDNATNFKNHLAELYSAGTPVKVYYPLLNPTTIQLPSIKSDLDDFGEYSSMDIEVTYG